jgi:hypothetical protein
MVTKAQLDRLTSRIEAIAPRNNENIIAVIWPREGETEAEAESRHFRERPQDRAAGRIIHVSFVGPKNGGPAELDDDGKAIR